MVIYMEMLRVAEKYSDEIIYEYYDDEICVGHFSILIEDNYIHGLRIFPWVRRRGYGTRMLQSLFNANKGKIFTLHVEVDNDSAYVMYTKLGFEKVSTEMAWGRMAHKMIKEVI